MQVIEPEKDYTARKPTIITLGNFDGVHIGHQKILKRVVERGTALNLPSLVYTFEPHPLTVVAPHKSPSLISTRRDKARLIASYGISRLILARFTIEFAARHPIEFVEEVIMRQLKATEVWVGHDYRFGKGKGGTVEHLKELGREFGFAVHMIPAQKKNGHIVSSSIIRRHIQGGKVKEAAQLLGRFHAVSGAVVKGDGRGATIGYPTANIASDGNLMPKNGVYAAYVTIGRTQYRGVANIGFAPTFKRERPYLEVHLLDFKRSIYGKELRIEFAERLRGERTFKGVAALTGQIEKDIERARRIV
ncbi:MAG: bifunctional riboflavin kinase/FAD synthetase [Deltaproteobacteria bacterium]|nr:bifunctional riboflavin kinase/FAD synthetase [Deltaproteobacteria bacterium]